MIRELDFSKITLRIMEHIDKEGDGDTDHAIAKLVGNTVDTLRRCLVGFIFFRTAFFANFALAYTNTTCPQRQARA